MERIDNWVSKPLTSRSSLSRTHSSLLLAPEYLRQSTQYNEYSPRANNNPELDLNENNADNGSKGPLINIADRHTTPDWYHLALVKMESKQDSVAPKLQRQTSIGQNEIGEACQRIQTACLLRKKWVYTNIKQNGHIGSLIQDSKVSLDVDRMKHILPKSILTQYSFTFVDGIAKVFKHENVDNKETENDENDNELFEMHSFDEYITDLQFIYKLMAFGPAKTLSYKRLKILQCRFKLHLLLNNEVEATESHSVPYRDFYNVRKIDNHIHHSACMHQKHLLRFMKDKYKSEPNKIVFSKDNKTLKQVFDDLNINIEYLSVDKLDVHAQQSTFQRFDKFNAKYNPLGQRPLRTLFLKIDNEINGEFLAQITREVIADLEYQKYQFCEYRLSIYGKKRQEWDIVSDWICNNDLHSTQVRWLIQIPRIYPIFKKKKLLNSFHQMLSNIFEPLFEVTLNPQSHPSLHLFLELIVGFDSVDDESSPESMENSKYPSPSNYTMESNPPYIYYMYYMWANLCKLNKLREERGFNTFALRPHSGEAGSLNHLASTFLLAHSINHGIRLRYSPILQYLYYLEQIGLSVSPLSNNILFEEYDKNPFPLFFERGLNVTLSSDDPLLIHYTKDALLEEYSIAAQVYNLSNIDLSEIARNSVLQCGWSDQQKREWIGKDYKTKQGSAANDIYRTNVPNSRLQFRYLMLKEEQTFIKSKGKDVLSKSRFFNKSDLDLKPINMSSDSEDAMVIKVDLSQNAKHKKRMKKKRNNRNRNALRPPSMREMQSRKSWDTDEEKEECDTRDKKKIIIRVDGLLQMIDSLYNDTINIKELGFRDMHNKVIYKPQYIDTETVINSEKHKRKRFVKCIFGNGYILSETNAYYTLNINDKMIVSIQKKECVLVKDKHKRLVETAIGNGIIIGSVDENRNYYNIAMDNMVTSILKSECKMIHRNGDRDGKDSMSVCLRDIYDSDLERVYELEVNGYPSDEAATQEKLFYRFIFAKTYFKVLTLNGFVIGFICGTKAKESKLTHETMSVHNRNGRHLCIHSVVIEAKYRRNGFGRRMMQLYVKQKIGSSNNRSLLSIRLCCKKHLISFYGDCGFRLVGESELNHGKDRWYEMAIEITHE